MAKFDDQKKTTDGCWGPWTPQDLGIWSNEMQASWIFVRRCLGYSGPIFFSGGVWMSSNCLVYIHNYIYIYTLPKFNMEPENGTEKCFFSKKESPIPGCHSSGSMLNFGRVTSARWRIRIRKTSSPPQFRTRGNRQTTQSSNHPMYLWLL